MTSQRCKIFLLSFSSFFFDAMHAKTFRDQKEMLDTMTCPSTIHERERHFMLLLFLLLSGLLSSSRTAGFPFQQQQSKILRASECTGFFQPKPSTTTQIHNSKLFGPDDFDNDGIGDAMRNNNENNDDSPVSPEGQELAKAFSEQIRRREQRASEDPPDDPQSNGGATEKAKTKFTGKNLVPPDASTRGSDRYFQSSSTTSSFNAGAGSMFGGSGRNTASSTPSSSNRSPREVMMQREYELVGRAERNLVFQGGLAIAILVFYIYIYQTGGIVTGEEATMGDAAADFGADDLIPFQDMVPLPKDTETSVWL